VRDPLGAGPDLGDARVVIRAGRYAVRPLDLDRLVRSR
jgi:hypothetical protein